MTTVLTVLKVVTCLPLIVLPVLGQLPVPPPPPPPSYSWSFAAHAATAAADILTPCPAGYRCYEAASGIWRGRELTVSVRGQQAAATASIIVALGWVGAKWPESRRVIGWINWVFTGTHAFAVVRNNR